jgi:hypothetical protein
MLIYHLLISFFKLAVFKHNKNHLTKIDLKTDYIADYLNHLVVVYFLYVICHLDSERI